MASALGGETAENLLPGADKRAPAESARGATVAPDAGRTRNSTSAADAEPAGDAQPVDRASGAKPARPLRADARRNRDAVLMAASDAFARDGVDASLEEIARQAGVGIGTLYRHFPTREALVFGVYRREVELLTASADELAATLPPDEALREWMRGFVRYAATKRGLIGMLKTMMATDAELFGQAKELIQGAARRLLATAAEAGAVRSDVGAEDLVRSMHGVCVASESNGGPACAERLVGLVYDGLRFGAPAER